MNDTASPPRRTSRRAPDPALNPAPDWEAIKRDYMTTDEPVVSLVQRHGVTKPAFFSRRAAGRWHRMCQSVSDPGDVSGCIAEISQALQKSIDKAVRRQERLDARAQSQAKTLKQEQAVQAEHLKMLRKLTQLGRSIASMTKVPGIKARHATGTNMAIVNRIYAIFEDGGAGEDDEGAAPSVSQLPDAGKI